MPVLEFIQASNFLLAFCYLQLFSIKMYSQLPASAHNLISWRHWELKFNTINCSLDINNYIFQIVSNSLYTF